ncbi:MAG: transcription-repair coupling factor, partial [Chromatiaceae bacterium]
MTEEVPAALHSPLDPPLPSRPGERLLWGRLYGASAALAIAQAARGGDGLLLAVVEDVQEAARLQAELGFLIDGATVPVLGFPDWETLPYDVFSPLPELVSERLLTLHRLPSLNRGVLVVPASTLLQRLAPPAFVHGHTLVLAVGDRLDLDATRRRLERAGYACVSQVIAHGEYAVRGSLLDLFPMGSSEPYRIDLFDDEVESIRTFDPDSQRSREKVQSIRLLPAREFPLGEETVTAFRQRYRAAVEGDPKQSLIYREVSEGRVPGGLEYYLPLFFDETATLFDYLPEKARLVEAAGAREAAAGFLAEVATRYEQRRHDIERPLYNARADSSIYFPSGSAGDHELRLGYSFRRASDTTTHGWGGQAIGAFWYGFPLEAWLISDGQYSFRGTRHSL